MELNKQCDILSMSHSFSSVNLCLVFYTREIFFILQQWLGFFLCKKVPSSLHLCASINLVILDTTHKDWNTGLINISTLDQKWPITLNNNIDVMAGYFKFSKLVNTLIILFVPRLSHSTDFIFWWWRDQCFKFQPSVYNVGLLSLAVFFSVRWQMKSTLKVFYLIFKMVILFIV